MELSQAIQLLRETLEMGSSFEVVTDGPQGPAAILSRNESSEVFKYLWQEPNGEWSVVTTITKPEIRKEIWLSAKAEKILKKEFRRLQRQGLSLQLTDRQIVAMTALNKPTSTISDLTVQEKRVSEEVDSILEALASKMQLSTPYVEASE